MSGILLPGQENRPESGNDQEQNNESGLVLPKGYGSHRRDQAEGTKDAPEQSESGSQAPPPVQTAETVPVSPADLAEAQQPAAQPEQADGRPQLDLRFPPSGVQVQCPSCGTPYTAAVFSIIDLGENPELKGALLGGQINVGVCPNCNTPVQLGAPLLVHEPEHDFLGVYVPSTGQGGDMQNQKMIGDLTQRLMRTIPSEKRRGYMLQPRQFLDWNGLIEKLWGFEGVTPEMLRRRNEQSALMQRLLRLADDDKALEIALERSKHLIDQEFFAMLEQTAMAVRSQGQPQVTQMLMGLRDALLDKTEAGRTIRSQQNRVQEILQSITPQTTQEEFLDLLIRTWNEPDGETLVGTLAMAAAPLVDYQLLMALSGRLDKTSDVEERSNLMQLRELLSEVQQQQQASQQAAAQQVQAVLQEVLQAQDMKAKLRELADYIDESFLGFVAANLQAAQQNEATAAARRFQEVYEAALEILQESMPPELRLLQQLIGAPDAGAARALLQENRDMLTKEFVETMNRVEQQFRETGRTEAADRIKSLRGQVSLML